MFDRLEKLIGEENLNKLKNKTVAIVGIGGVGGYTLETLVRNGIENIILVDGDVVEESNKNRQIIALTSNIGISKVDVFEKRIKDININTNITKLNLFLTEENKEELFKYKIDYLIDACDTVDTKIMLILECLNRNIEIISSMGTGNKFEPKKLCITQLSKTSYDPLAKAVRKKLSKLNVKNNIIVLSSTEEINKNDTNTVLSYSTVPNIAGILIADYVIKDIINDINEKKN